MGKLSGIVKRIWKAARKPFGYPRLTETEWKNLTSNLEFVDDGKNILIDFGKNDLRRSLYTFFKFFELAGYRVFVKPNNHLFAEMKSDIYGVWAIEEGLFKICEEPKFVDYRFSLRPLKGYKLVTDRYFVEKEKRGTYFLPITMHPLMYKNGYWNKKVETHKRRLQSIFMAGSFGAGTYKRIEKQNLFNVITRIRVYDFLKTQSYTHIPLTREQVESNNEEGQVCILNRRITRSTCQICFLSGTSWCQCATFS
jgi:hypothetical protein